MMKFQALFLALLAAEAEAFGAGFVPTSAAVSPAKFQQTASAIFLAAALVAAPLNAEAAGGRSGGRVGGRAPSAPAARTYSRPDSTPAPVQKTTNVYVAPAPAPVMVGGGYGYGGYGGGFGYAAPSPGMTGLAVGLSLADTIIQEQRRQAFLQQQLQQQRQLGRDEAMIADLQRQLAAQDSKLNSLQMQQQQPPQPQVVVAPVAAAPVAVAK